jgi:hypothetical protein
MTEDTYLLTKQHIQVTPCESIVIQDQERVIHVYRLEKIAIQEPLLI